VKIELHQQQRNIKITYGALSLKLPNCLTQKSNRHDTQISKKYKQIQKNEFTDSVSVKYYPLSRLLHVLGYQPVRWAEAASESGQGGVQQRRRVSVGRPAQCRRLARRQTHLQQGGRTKRSPEKQGREKHVTVVIRFISIVQINFAIRCVSYN
jgi:hypothetical protein